MVVVQPVEVAAQVGLELEHLRLFRPGQAIPLLLAQGVQPVPELVYQEQPEVTEEILLLLVDQAHLHLLLQVLFLLAVAVAGLLVSVQVKTEGLAVVGLVYTLRQITFREEQEIHQALHQVREVMVEMGKAVR